MPKVATVDRVVRVMKIANCKNNKMRYANMELPIETC